VSGPFVVGYDGSEASEPALGRAIQEASSAGASVVVVSVAEMPFDPEAPMSYGTYTDAPTSIPIRESPELERILGLARERIDAAGVQGDYVWEAGDVATALVREAKDRGAAAIVLGKGHHGRLGRWLGTDVAQEVERSSDCPVIVVD
jgi:nucleotide-binding universal stress UspA family protein